MQVLHKKFGEEVVMVHWETEEVPVTWDASRNIPYFIKVVVKES